jgi:hypothetical protein
MLLLLLAYEAHVLVGLYAAGIVLQHCSQHICCLLIFALVYVNVGQQQPTCIFPISFSQKNILMIKFNPNSNVHICKHISGLTAWCYHFSVFFIFPHLFP